MAAEFVLFPKLITELRLEIWRLAMPASLARSLYPYKKGCWMVENRDLELDPNGHDLQLKFDTSLLDPLKFELPLYAVNREARNVTLGFVHEENLVLSQDAARNRAEFIRHFNPKTDTMFLPTADVETFLMEQIDRLSKPDLEGRYYSTARPVLACLAVTAPGLAVLKDELGNFIDISAPIDLLYVVDVPRHSTVTLGQLEYAIKRIPLTLEDTSRARLTWQSSERQWEADGDTVAIASMKQLVKGLDDPGSSTSNFDLKVYFVCVNASGGISTASS